MPPASPSTARAINDRLALRLLQREGALTAGRLKELTGLSRPSVADLVERLQDAGLITVVGEAGAQRRGPNARLYGIVADRAHLAALDVRTHGVRVVVTDLVGAVLAEDWLPVEEGIGAESADGRAVAFLERTAREAGAVRLHSVGIGAPGLIDPATGELRDSSGLPAWHRRLIGTLQQRLPARVLVENETNLAAVAEQRDGAARDRETFVLLWLGSGVGAAVVLDGSLRRGASGGTGEIGFLPVPGTVGLPSATGCEGGFHSLVGSHAITELAAEHGLFAAGKEGELGAATVVREAVEVIEAGEVAEAGAGDEAGAARARDEAEVKARAAFLDILADRLALGAASVAAVLDPGCVVLGGEVGRAGGAPLAARVEARLAAMSPLATDVRAGTLGGAAVLRGALLVARDSAQDELFGPGR
ncbi:ROK family transcriptional regulator [Streptomyces sp. NBC_01304]|uniref:ROK family transcriptional regulator n=1 Tax=Streptomyces sp. NBC_01304 TaxID=2903818 RepID=UPI002E15AB62|nr:ROK family protein [Streptomyces sp. NBC_01304]